MGWKLEGLGAERVLVRGDEAKLRQVWINLLGNAVKFTRELEGLGEAQRRLAIHLRDLAQQHDMEGIVRLLEQIR